MPWLLRTLHSHILEQLNTSRKTLEERVRAIQANYALEDGETERLLLYHSRVQRRISKWLNMLAQSNTDRLGLTLVESVEVNQRRKRRCQSRVNFARHLNAAGVGRGRLTGFIAQKNLTLPVVKVGEPDPVGEIPHGDELKHTSELSLPRHAIGFKTVLRIVGLEVVFRIFRVN